MLSLIEHTVNDRSLVHTYVRAAHYVLPESSVLGLFSARCALVLSLSQVQRSLNCVVTIRDWTYLVWGATPKTPRL